MRVVICGGGIIGCSTAYHLALRGVACTVIDRCGVACAASGKAGGFLARDWGGTGPMGELARTSFDMHMELSKTFTECDYRRVNTLSIDVNTGDKSGSSDKVRKEGLPEWIDGRVESMSCLGTTDTTAQVHPYKLSNELIQRAIQKCPHTKVVIGLVESVVLSNNKVTGVQLSGELVPADVVVIAMGPWSGQAKKWFPTLPLVTGSPAHSIVLSPEAGTKITADCLFLELHGGQGDGLTSPEVYPRPDGTVYVCAGDSKDKPVLSDDPAQIRSSDQTKVKMQKTASRVCSHLASAEVLRHDCCFLPTPTSGSGPLIGSIPGVEGAYVGTGHTCWGILNAPVTGACLAELIVDGKCSILDLSSFSPSQHH